MELNRVDSNDEIYTGVLRYKDDDYQFVFSDTKLRLIPCSEKQRSSMWKFGMKEIAKGTYTQDEPPRMEEDILAGTATKVANKSFSCPKRERIFPSKIQCCLLI